MTPLDLDTLERNLRKGIVRIDPEVQLALIARIRELERAQPAGEAVTFDGMRRAALHRAIDALLTVGRGADERKARQCQRDIDEIRALLAAQPPAAAELERPTQAPEKS